MARYNELVMVVIGEGVYVDRWDLDVERWRREKLSGSLADGEMRVMKAGKATYYWYGKVICVLSRRGTLEDWGHMELIRRAEGMTGVDVSGVVLAPGVRLIAREGDKFLADSKLQWQSTEQGKRMMEVDRLALGERKERVKQEMRTENRAPVSPIPTGRINKKAPLVNIELNDEEKEDKPIVEQDEPDFEEMPDMTPEGYDQEIVTVIGSRGYVKEWPDSLEDLRRVMWINGLAICDNKAVEGGDFVFLRWDNEFVVVCGKASTFRKRGYVTVLDCLMIMGRKVLGDVSRIVLERMEYGAGLKCLDLAKEGLAEWGAEISADMSSGMQGRESHGVGAGGG